MFVTGQREVLALCNKLKKTFPTRRYQKQSTATKTVEKNDNNGGRGGGGVIPKIDLDKYNTTDKEKEDGSELEMCSGDEADGFSTGEDEACDVKVCF